MTTILRTNAFPVYAFLSHIRASQLRGEIGEPLKVLDCGAGGKVPPLALFAEHGFEAYGIDISNDQLEKAKKYCTETGIKVDLRPGDMRQISYPDEAFDCVYEHYSMCHLSKSDTAKAIREMCRVTMKNGLCFLGVISQDTWPKNSFGEETLPGEYLGDEGGKLTLHSIWGDNEIDQMVSGWEIIKKEKRMMYLQAEAEAVTSQMWMKMYTEEGDGYTEAEWRETFAQRHRMYNYTHLYYLLRKQ